MGIYMDAREIIHICACHCGNKPMVQKLLKVILCRVEHCAHRCIWEPKIAFFKCITLLGCSSLDTHVSWKVSIGGSQNNANPLCES